MAKNNKQGGILPSGQPGAAKKLKEITQLQVLDPNVTYVDGIAPTEPLDVLSDAYRVHSWIYTAAWTVASNLAGLEWKAYRENADHKWEEYQKHELLPLLARPNPYMTAYQLREFLYLSLELTGNAYWVLARNEKSRVINQVWTVPSSSMKPVSTKDKFVDHYVYAINGKQVQFAYDEVIHFKYANPNDMVHGQGSLTAVKLAVMQDLHAQAWNKYFFQNAGRPDAALQTDGVLSEDVRKRVVKAWEMMHRGSDKRGKTAVLEGGLKYQELNRTPKDMDFTALRNLSREEILSAFGVPPIMAGVLDQTNYNTAKEQKRIFWERTCIPKKKSTDEMLTLRASQLFFDPQTHFEADTSHVEALRADMNQLSITAKNFYEIGIPLNEVIDKLDLPFDPVEGGDVPLAFGGVNTKPGTGTDVPVDPGAADPNATPTAGEGQQPPKKGMDHTRAQKVAAWKSFDGKIRTRELDMALALRGYFGSQRQRVLKAWKEKAHLILQGRLKKADQTIHTSLIFDEGAEKKKLRSTADKYISGTYYDFAVESARKNGGVSFDLENPRAIDYINAKQIKLAKEVTDTTFEKLQGTIEDGIKDSVADGLSEGDSIDMIASRIDDVYEFSRESRSTTIARTETVSAANGGNVEGMREAGVERKSWLSSKDDRVWDTHDALDGDEVGVDEDFISDSGAHLEFPGDPSGPPEEIINCRCTIVAVQGD